jgi:hypothetical protein
MRTMTRTAARLTATLAVAVTAAGLYAERHHAPDQS